MHTSMTLAGFVPALRGKTPTHINGNQLDQLWVRNLSITNAIVADPIDQVSDHNLIQVKMEAVCISRVEQV
jgi:endonuclease/exonuclease/phosphatase (EEP) superfamily protein YafD